MQIILKELGNQQSSYLAGKLGGEFYTHAPDLAVTSRNEEADPVPNPLLELVSPIIRNMLLDKTGLVAVEFPHETGPAVIIGSQERSPELAQALLEPLQKLIGQSCVTEVIFEKSFYRY